MSLDVLSRGVEREPVELLQLVSEPRRWALLQALAKSDRRVGELTEIVGERQNLVSYHLGELRRAGLVSSRRSAADARDVYYRAGLLAFRDHMAGAAQSLHPGLRLVSAPAEGPRLPVRATKVLFLCTGNSARSQMAEAFVEHHARATIQARSAGSQPKPLHPNAVRVMAERGIDISGRSSKHLRRFARSRFDRVITLCDKVREICPDFPGQPIAAHWSMPDPAASGSDDDTYPEFQRAADEIELRVELLLADLTADTERRRHVR